MSRHIIRLSAVAFGIGVIGLAVLGTRGAAQAPASEWRDINGNASATRFAPLSQIDASNVERLSVAWQWKGADSPVDLGGDTLPRNLPIYANGKLITTADRKSVV